MSEIEITWCAIPEHTGLESQLQAAERRAEEAEEDASILFGRVAEAVKRIEEAEAALAEERQDRGTGFTRRYARIKELEELVGRYSEALEHVVHHASEDWGPNTARLGHITDAARRALTASRPSTTEEEKT